MSKIAEIIKVQASETVRRLNPQLFKPYAETKASDTRETPKLESNPRNEPLATPQTQEASKARFLVRVTSIRKRLIDEDNLCEKYVVDCCRYSGLLFGDSPDQAHIITTQRKATKGEAERIEIEIEQLSEDRI